MAKDNTSGMLIQGILGSQALDRSGEMLDVEGADVSDVKLGRVSLNWEHKSDKDEGATAADVVGRIIYVKKIFKESDCENDQQLKFWESIRLPFIYGIGRLFDAAGHKGAQELAAIIRDCHVNNEPILVGFSVEGTKLEVVSGHIKSSILRACAITIKPCNATSIMTLIADPNAPDGFEQETSAVSDVKDDLEKLVAVEKAEIMRANLLSSTESSINPFLGDLQDDSVKKSMKTLLKYKLFKALTAGGMDTAPSTLTGHQALAKEVVVTEDQKKKAIEIAKRHKGIFNKAEFMQTLKSEMPEVSDEFVEHFTDIVADIKVKKDGKSFELIIKMEALSVDLKKAAQDTKKMRPNTFEYFREGMHAPHTIQHHGDNKFSLDGNELTDQEVEKIIDNVKNNLATLRYKKKPLDTLKKAEEYISELHSMPDFKEKPGLYALLDFHHLKNVADEHGGDIARGYLRSIAASLAENASCRAFMLSNNQFLLYAKESEQLYFTLRFIREKLNEIVPVGGTYPAQFSAGIGATIGLAHKALEQTEHKPGMVYSLEFGFEGAIPAESIPTSV